MDLKKMSCSFFYYGEFVRVCMQKHTKAFRTDATALQWVDGPVIVLESVHQLQDSADTSDGGVDGGCADEL